MPGKVMEVREYLDNGGVRCVVCRSENLRPSPVDTHYGGASQGVECLDCGAEWEDLYTLTGFTDLEVPVSGTPTDELETMFSIYAKAIFRSGLVSAQSLHDYLDVVLDEVTREVPNAE